MNTLTKEQEEWLAEGYAELERQQIQAILVDHLPRQLSTSGSHTLLSSIFGERLLNDNIWPNCSDALYESMWVAEDIIHHSPMLYGQRMVIENNQGSTQLDKVRDKLCVV